MVWECCPVVSERCQMVFRRCQTLYCLFIIFFYCFHRLSPFSTVFCVFHHFASVLPSANAKKFSVSHMHFFLSLLFAVLSIFCFSMTLSSLVFFLQTLTLQKSNEQTSKLKAQTRQWACTKLIAKVRKWFFLLLLFSITFQPPHCWVLYCPGHIT